jgi:heme-degrading monooxygenase HmoA
MFAVIFEVNPRPARWDDYLGQARLLKPEVEAIDGFLSNDRFASRRREGWLLSLSLWRDEKALIRWRTQAAHHMAQEKGRSGIFRDYRLRVGEVVSDTGLPAGAVLGQSRFDVTEVGAAKAATLTDAPIAELPSPGHAPLPVPLGEEAFESIYRPGQGILLQFWRDAAQAEAWLAAQAGGARHRLVRIIRDYGMFDRAEAPQYYPPAPPPDDRGG